VRVEVSATGRYIVQRSPTEWCVCVCVSLSVIRCNNNCMHRTVRGVKGARQKKIFVM